LVYFEPQHNIIGEILNEADVDKGIDDMVSDSLRSCRWGDLERVNRKRVVFRSIAPAPSNPVMFCRSLDWGLPASAIRLVPYRNRRNLLAAFSHAASWMDQNPQPLLADFGGRSAVGAYRYRRGIAAGSSISMSQLTPSSSKARGGQIQ